jgi:GrpB-like predicted nucleotidyltransferase (UPF0157 family)
MSQRPSTVANTEDALGLEQGIVLLRDYTPLWAELFAVEAVHIRNALGALARGVQHVGSTAVPGLKAKPILDIAVGVSTLNDLPHFEAALAKLDYEYAHWGGVDHELVFGKGKVRTHLVHIVEYDSSKWHGYIAFRTALLSDRRIARQYEQVKIDLAASHASDRAAYTAANSEFICNVLSAA